MPEPEARFDYVVIGAGTAGCALASRLSEDPSTRVLLLEAGGRDLHPWIHVPVGYLYTQNNPATDWCLRTEPEPGLNGRSLAYPRGKVLGGCSAINGMIYMRGQARDYDQMAPAGQCRLVLGGCAAALQTLGGFLRRCRRNARCRWRVADRGAAHPLGDPGSLSRGRGRAGHSPQRRLQSG